MNNSKFLFSTLIAAAAMSATAYAADYTVSGTLNSTDVSTYTSGDNVTFSGATGYFSDYNARTVYAFNIILGSDGATGDQLTINNGTTTRAVVFSGAVSGAGNFVVSGTGDVPKYTDYVFTGDLTAFTGNISRTSAEFNSGEYSIGAGKVEGILQFGGTVSGDSFTDSATTYASSASATDNVISNISGTGAISTTSVLRYNYTGGTNGETLGIGNSSISARYLEFKGGASYVVSSSLTGSNSTASNNTLKVSAGSLALSGSVSNFGNIIVASGATLSNAGTLDLSGAAVSLTSAITNTGTVTVSSGTTFALTSNMASSENVYTLVSGGTISGWDATTLGLSNFTVDGEALGGRSTVDVSTEGSVTIDAVSASLVWAGSTSSTWDVEATENWTNNGTSDKFYNLDSVEFTSTTDGGTVDVAAGVTVGDFTISSGTHTLTRSDSGYVAITGTATIKNGATLILGTSTDATGLLRGAITVENGGTLQFNAKDITGYNGGDNSLQTITIAEGGSLILNVDGNETFAGTLNLGGTLGKGSSGGDNTAWDIWGGNSTINVTSATAKIEANLRIGRSGAVVTLNDGASLTVSGTINYRDGNSSYTLGVNGGNGSGSFTFTGTSGLIQNGVKLGNGNLIVGDGASESILTVGRLEMGDRNGGDSGSLVINANATLKVTGSSNVDDYKTTSLLLGEWNNTTQASIKGILLAQDAELRLGDYGGSVTIENGGTLSVKGMGYSKNTGNSFNVTLNDGGKLVLGESGWSASKSGTATLNAGTIGAYADSMSITRDLTLSSATGTTFDTQKYVFADDGNSVSRGTDAGEIAVSGVLSGAGAIIKDGAGTLTLSGANTYTGGTTISAGTLVAANASALGTGNVSVESDATLSLGTNSVTVKNLSGAGKIGLADGTTTATLTVDSDADSTFSGTITTGVFNDDSLTISLVKTGTGTLTLSEMSANLSTVSINAGSLVAGVATLVGSDVSVADGAQLSYAAGEAAMYANSVEFASGATFVIDLAGVSLEDGADSITLDIIAASAIKFGDTQLGGTSTSTFALLTSSSASDEVTIPDGYVSFANGADFADYTQSWSYADGMLSLTLAIPEPSLFGLLAGLGALTLVGTRRRRR